MKVKSQMRCIKKKLNRSTYNVRQSQAKILDIQNNWNHDWKPLDQSCLYHSLYATLFFFLHTYIFFSLQIFLFFFSSANFSLFLFSAVSRTGKYDHRQILFLYCMTDQHFIWSCGKEKGNWLGAQLWMNQVRCSVKE